MTAYGAALFIHLLGVVTLFGGIAIQQLGAAGLRRARTADEVRRWLGLIRPTGRMLPAAMLVLLASGLYMTAREWSLRTPWIGVGLTTLVLMVIVGAAVVGRKFAAIGRASAAEAVTSERSPRLERLLATPLTWIVMTALHGVAVGVVWLMTNKPDRLQSVAAVLAATAAGAGVGALLSRSAGRVAPLGSPAASAEP